LDQEPLLFLVFLLLFLPLLFKYLGVVLGDVRVNGGRHGDIEEKAKSSSVYVLFVIRRVCGQTWTRVRVKYYNY